ncbi:MAG: hypothetical protein NZ891_04440, partial [bacterium]|nr:hypothetical protein [bacterium]MDW8163972.1 hypothetical protein [Candidatus Omnitrophota bacterium]
MGNRDRFINVMCYKEVDRVPINLVGPWVDTLERWKKEGLPEGVDVHHYLGVDNFGIKIINISGETGIFPLFEEKIIKEDEETKIFIDRYGRVVKDFKSHTSMPHWLEFPVKTKEDLERIIDEKFNPDSINLRYSEKWFEKLQKARKENESLILIDG